MIYIVLECSVCATQLHLRYMARGRAIATARDMGWRVEREGSPAWCAACRERGLDGDAETRHKETPVTGVTGGY